MGASSLFVCGFDAGALALGLLFFLHEKDLPVREGRLDFRRSVSIAPLLQQVLGSSAQGTYSSKLSGS